jgi:predicted nucleic acid-binding protein
LGREIGTIDALLGQLCIRHDLTMLTDDQHFSHMAYSCPLRLWRPAS